MGEKHSKGKRKMDKNEFLLNKPILKEINQKFKEGSHMSGSQRAPGDEYQGNI